MIEITPEDLSVEMEVKNGLTKLQAFARARSRG